MAAGDLADVLPALKVAYDTDVKTIMPEDCPIQENTDFGRKELSAVGRSFNFPWEVTNEWGYSPLGTTGAATTLNSPINGRLEEASVKPYECWFAGRLTFVAAARGSEAGKKSFIDMAKYKMQNVMKQHRRVTEIKLLHGTMDIGVVASFTGATITLTAGTSSPAILSLLEGATVDIKQADGTTDRANSVGLTVSSVDTSSATGAYTVTFSSITGTPIATDRLYLKSGSSSLTGNEMPGLMRLGSITSGSIWGVAVAGYNALRANATSSFGLVAVSKILKEHVKNVNKGGSGKYWLVVHPSQYQSLANDETAKQMFDSAYSENKLKSGTKSLGLYTTSGQELVIISHPFQKEGSFGLFETKNIIRLGSSDHTMEVGGTDLIQWVPGTNYYDFASFTDQCVVLDKPAHNLTATGVTVA
jgi:hypothetical protein